MCMNCKMYINFFIFLYLEKTTYFLIFYHSIKILHIPQELRIRSGGTERHSASN